MKDKKDIKQKYDKEYREANKEHTKEKITCNVCGSIICKGVLARHIKTSKHQSQMPENYEN